MSGKIDLMLSVTDTGIGISEDSLDTIFEAFKQQDGQSTKQYGGTGLGLTITKRLVEIMGGAIGVKSKIGKGSRFDIVLRKVACGTATVKSPPVVPAEERRIAFDPSTIMIVDDIRANRSLVKACLQNTPLNFLEAENGREALRILETEKPDLILMDIRMPVMDGCDATQNIRARPEFRDIPIIALTASSMKSDQDRIMQCGFDGILTKPFQKSDLLRRLSHFIAYEKLGVSSPNEPAIEIRNDDRATPLSKTALAMLPKLLRHLESNMTPLWEKARKDGFFDDIAEFAEQLVNAGRKSEAGPVIRFGETLKSEVSTFDIEKINKTLDDYPKLIEELKHLSSDSAETRAHVQG